MSLITRAARLVHRAGGSLRDELDPCGGPQRNPPRICRVREPEPRLVLAPRPCVRSSIRACAGHRCRRRYIARSCGLTDGQPRAERCRPSRFREFRFLNAGTSSSEGLGNFAKTDHSAVTEAYAFCPAQGRRQQHLNSHAPHPSPEGGQGGTRHLRSLRRPHSRSRRLRHFMAAAPCHQR